MAIRFILSLLCLLSLLSAKEECGWKVKYVGFPNKFHYYSSCNDNKFFSVAMTSITEYTRVGPTYNTITFELDGDDWNWLTAHGEQVKFHGFDCIFNKYVARLSSLLPGNCFMNLTTYLFEESAEIHIDNFRYVFIDKYALKWNTEIDEWPWFFSNDYLELCMQFEADIGGVTDLKQNEFWLNFTFAADFQISIPKLITCNDVINVNVDIIMESGQNLVDIRVNIPYCGGRIYFDPIVHSSYIGTPAPKKLTGGEIALIVFATLICIALCIGLVYFCYSCCKKRRVYDGTYYGLLQT